MPPLNEFPIRNLGPLRVSALGLGCMRISEYYGPWTEHGCIDAIQRALDLGITLLDTADVYGPNVSEQVVGRAVVGRSDVVIATMFGSYQGDSGRPEAVRRACEASLERLGVETIDLYSQHRVDPSVPIEETWGAMHELVLAGKVRYLGLSEVAPDTIRRAHRIHPVATVESEYSLWTRDPEVDDVLATTRELGVGFIAYSPLGRKFLTGEVRSTADLAAGDSRRKNPRFQAGNLERNLALVERLRPIAERRGISLAQLALAWLLAQGPDIVPIPGTCDTTHLDDNLAAVDVALTDQELMEIDAIWPVGAASGDRYSNMTYVYA